MKENVRSGQLVVVHTGTARFEPVNSGQYAGGFFFIQFFLTNLPILIIRGDSWLRGSETLPERRRETIFALLTATIERSFSLQMTQKSSRATPIRTVL